jgi:hypothetical protein
MAIYSVALIVKKANGKNALAVASISANSVSEIKQKAKAGMDQIGATILQLEFIEVPRQQIDDEK